MEVTLHAFRKRFTYDPVKDLLGKGGFGEVYKAYDNEDQIYVALKISQGTTDDKYNLIHEIKRFKKLSHPNIVRHIEAYEVNTGSSDIHGKPILYHVGILEYADHGTLGDLLKKGIPSPSEMESLTSDIIDGLAYLHSQGIIHRDLKPSNILLLGEGDNLRAKITDFGIAKNTDATAMSTQLVGTVEYMAPEYFTTGNITPASDVWSLGVMLLEAFTGSHPFGKTSQGLSNEQIIHNILNKEMPSLQAMASISVPLKKIVNDCLRRDLELRPQNAEVVKQELLDVSSGYGERTVVIRPKVNSDIKKDKKVPGWEKLGKTPKQRQVIVVLCIVAIAFMLSTLFYWNGSDNIPGNFLLEKEGSLVKLNSNQNDNPQELYTSKSEKIKGDDEILLPPPEKFSHTNTLAIAETARLMELGISKPEILKRRKNCAIEFENPWSVIARCNERVFCYRFWGGFDNSHDNICVNVAYEIDKKSIETLKKYLIAKYQIKHEGTRLFWAILEENHKSKSLDWDLYKCSEFTILFSSKDIYGNESSKGVVKYTTPDVDF